MAKKRNNICIRAVVISEPEFESIMRAHKHYFDAKGKYIKAYISLPKKQN
ncbi:hypothetical protein [Borrelia miyamotoi]|nr:hypothetical protein [Borrelia miyamotoi]